jgi:hypothetical protein
MGQLVAVTERPSSRPGVVRFETNRSLTGMGHERFRSVHDAVGPRPAAVLARRLLGSGQVESVHVYGNVVTVDLVKGYSSSGLADIVRNMYQYWKPGMEMPTFETPDASSDAPAAVADGADGSSGADAEYLRLVPATLVERSRAALAKWKATH